MSESNPVEAVSTSVKLMSIGRAWVNDRMNESGTSPVITVKLDQELGINITIGANTNILLFANKKRDEINPRTNLPYQDADYRVAIQLPAEAVDKEIARQKAVREANSPAPTAVVAETPAPTQA